MTKFRETQTCPGGRCAEFPHKFISYPQGCKVTNWLSLPPGAAQWEATWNPARVSITPCLGVSAYFLLYVAPPTPDTSWCEARLSGIHYRLWQNLQRQSLPVLLGSAARTFLHSDNQGRYMPLGRIQKAWHDSHRSFYKWRRGPGNTASGCEVRST